MGLKNKVFGTIAAAALTVSMIGGAAAAPNSGQVTGTVVVDEGVCGIQLSQSNSNLGTWKWIDTAYVYQSGNTAMTISGTLFPAEPNGVCDINVATDGLVGQTDSSKKIGTDNFDGSIDGTNFYPLSAFVSESEVAPPGKMFEDVQSGPGSVFLKLRSVPNTVTPQTYQGTITLTVSNPNP